MHFGDVRLTKLSYYDILDTIIHPSALVPSCGQQLQEATFVFTLTPKQATDLAKYCDTSQSTKQDHNVQVQLRFCLFEALREQADCFPPGLKVKVNDRVCQLPRSRYKNASKSIRTPCPLDVTANVQLSPTLSNTIVVQWSRGVPPNVDARIYCLAAYLVRRLSCAELLQCLQLKGLLPADLTRAMIREKLGEAADSEVVATMLNVSLNCPLGRAKMSLPCRASTCSHLQCFDADFYLRMNEFNPKWHCPVCNRPARYEDLAIDGYFKEVLLSPLLHSDDVQIRLHTDGSWTKYSETENADVPKKPARKMQIMAVEHDLSETKTLVHSVQKAAAETTTEALQEQQQPISMITDSGADVVDLTLSDSEDVLPVFKIKTVSFAK